MKPHAPTQAMIQAPQRQAAQRTRRRTLMRSTRWRFGDRAFTLIELLMTVAVLAVAAAIVAPILGDDHRVRVMAAASILTSDLEYAQVMTISFPTDPLVLRFEPEKQTYWIAASSDTETPLPREDSGQPYLVEFGEGRASSAAGVVITLDQVTANTIAFDPSGALTDFNTTPLIQLGDRQGVITISISPMTGTVREFNGTIEEWYEANGK